MHNNTQSTQLQVGLLADAITAPYRGLIPTANTGMRFGELAGPRLERLDLLRRSATVAEQLTEVRGHVQRSEPKHGSRRTVTLPRFLCDELALHVAPHPPVEGHVFTMSECGLLRCPNFRRRVRQPTVEAIGLEGSTFHSLRHGHAAALNALGEHRRPSARGWDTRRSR